MNRWIESSAKELQRAEVRRILAEIRAAEKVEESDVNSETSEETEMVEENADGTMSTDKNQENDDNPDPERKDGNDDSDEERFTVYAIFPKGHPLHTCAKSDEDEEE